MEAVSLFKRRDVEIVAAAVLLAPGYWVFSPHPTFGSLLRIALFSCLLFVVIYAFNRFTETKDRPPSSRDLAVLVASGLACIPGCMWLDNDIARAAAFLVLGSGVLYSVPFGRKEPRFRLKRLYLVKPIVVALGFSLQWVIFTGSVRPLVLSFVLWHFCDAFVSTSLLDVLDWKQDAVEGVRTLAVVHGIRHTVSILAVVNVVGLVVGVVILAMTRAPELALVLFPRQLVTQYRLLRMRAGKAARVRPYLETMPLRILGLVGIALYWARIR